MVSTQSSLTVKMNFLWRRALKMIHIQSIETKIHNATLTILVNSISLGSDMTEVTAAGELNILRAKPNPNPIIHIGITSCLIVISFILYRSFSEYNRHLRSLIWLFCPEQFTRCHASVVVLPAIL